MTIDMPNIDTSQLKPTEIDRLQLVNKKDQPVKIQMLYGSRRENPIHVC